MTKPCTLAGGRMRCRVIMVQGDEKPFLTLIIYYNYYGIIRYIIYIISAPSLRYKIDTKAL